MRDTLTAAGIPVSDYADPDPVGGAVIEVDTGADTAGGVCINWGFPRRSMIAHQLPAVRLRSHPVLQYFFDVKRAMREAILAILNAAGLTAVRSENRNDVAPLQVLVSEQPAAVPHNR